MLWTGTCIYRLENYYWRRISLCSMTFAIMALVRCHFQFQSETSIKIFAVYPFFDRLTGLLCINYMSTVYEALDSIWQKIFLRCSNWIHQENMCNNIMFKWCLHTTHIMTEHQPFFIVHFALVQCDWWMFWLISSMRQSFIDRLIICCCTQCVI